MGLLAATSPLLETPPLATPFTDPEGASGVTQRMTDWPCAVRLYTYGGKPRFRARALCFVIREIASRTRRFVFTAYSDIPSSSASSQPVASGRVARYERIARRGSESASAVIRRAGRGWRDR